MWVLPTNDDRYAEGVWFIKGRGIFRYDLNMITGMQNRCGL